MKKIVVLSSIRFHMFDLARILKEIGWQVRLLCGVPRFKLDADLHPYTFTHPLLVGLLMGTLRYNLPVPYRMKCWEHLARKDLSNWAAKQLDDAVILDALSGWGLEAGKEIQRRGGKVLCNRGSTHILYQKHILDEEHDRWGVPRSEGFPGWNIQRQLAEYEMADAIAVPSRFVYRSFVEYGVAKEKIHICPYGVSLDGFYPLPKEDKKFRVIFVGSRSVRKGIGYLFEAVRPLVKSGYVELWLVGGTSPDAKKILRKNRDLFIDKDFQHRSKLPWFYSQANVMILSSIEEGLACVQAEAMACGVPVIATHNTGAQDLFTDGREGFIVPIRNPLAIREKIEWMIEHPNALKQMGVAALQRVKKIGGWMEYGQKCSELYLNILKEK